MMSRPATSEFASRWWAFAVLCCASFARLVLAESFPPVRPTATSLTVASGLLAAIFAAVSAVQGVSLPGNKRGSARIALAGALLLCGPQCALLLRAADVSAKDYFLAGSLVPVVVAIVSAASGNTSLTAKTLWPGIAASAALLLMFPEPRVHSLPGVLSLVLIPCATGTGAVLVQDARPSEGGWWQAFAMLGACAVFFVAMPVRRGTPMGLSWQACAFDLVTFLSTLLSLRCLGQLRYSAYLVIVPLAVLIYGLLLLRPEISVRTAVGLAVLLASCIALLRMREPDGSEHSFRLLE